MEIFTSKLHPVSAEESLSSRLSGNNSMTASMHLKQQAFAIGSSDEISFCVFANKDVPHVTISISKEIIIRDGENILTASTEGMFLLVKKKSLQIVVCYFVVIYIFFFFLLVSRSVQPIKHAAFSSQERKCNFKIPQNTIPSVHGAKVTLQYHINAVFHISSLIPQELEVSIPIVLCHPRVFEDIPKVEIKELAREEFSVPSHSSEENVTEVQGLRIIPKTPIRGEVFYKAQQIFYCDVPDDSFSSLRIRAQSTKKISLKGRYNEPPTLFNSDVQGSEISNGK